MCHKSMEWYNFLRMILLRGTPLSKALILLIRDLLKNGCVETVEFKRKLRYVFGDNGNRVYTAVIRTLIPENNVLLQSVFVLDFDKDGYTVKRILLNDRFKDLLEYLLMEVETYETPRIPS